MKKLKVLWLTVVVLLAAVGPGYSADLDCRVKRVEGKTVVLDCGKAGKMKAGDEVKIKPGANKKREQIVGC